MTTLAPGGRITRAVLDAEIARLRTAWAGAPSDSPDEAILAEVLGPEALAKTDLFDRAQLAAVVRICRTSESASDAGRRLFAISRDKRKVTNDADRLRKYLARFGLDWKKVRGVG
jgi:transcriptional regulatory protein RtcR